MKLLICILTFILIEFASACSENEISITFTKWTGDPTVDEVFYLYAPGTTQLLYTSPVPSEGTIMTRTVCVQKTEYDTYDLKFSNGAWHHTSHVEFQSPYGTVTFKSPHSDMTYNLMFYTPITKNSDFYVLTGREMHWTDLNWSVGSSTHMPATTIPEHVASSRIFARKVIMAPSTTPAAYEVRVNYKHGVLIYVNGVEALRDNMSEGIIETTSTNVNSYNSYDYRGAVRNGFELGTGSVVVAIEVHADETIEVFDAWLTVYGSAWSKEDSTIVYYYPVNETLLQSTYSYTECSDYNLVSALYSDSLQSGLYFDFNFGIGQSNGFMYYVDSRYGRLTDVEVAGHNIETNRWVTIMDRVISSENDAEMVFTGSTYLDNFKTLRIFLEGASSLPIGWNEIRPVLRYVTFERDTPLVEDKLLEFKTTDNIQERLLDSTYFHCEKQGATPLGVSISSKCVLSGKTTAVGSYQVNMIAFDYIGPQYFTVYLSIIEGGNEDNSLLYDESYKTMPIVLTTIFCVLVLVLAVVGVFFLLKPVKFRKTMKVVNSPPPTYQVPMDPSKNVQTAAPVVSMGVPYPGGVYPSPVLGVINSPPSYMQVV